MIKNIQIEHITIGREHKPFIIAEMSGNHNQSLDRALKIVDAAADAGAHAIKLQTYTPDTMTIDASGGLFEINDDDSLWKGRNLYDLYKEAHTPWEWHKPIFDHARKRGLVIFSTPFDETAVDFLEELGVGAYKIASFENSDHPLLKKVAATGKPVIMSTGMATLAQIDESVSILRSSGCQDLILLKCTSTYPASPESSNVKTIPHLSEAFQCHVGLSDHTMGIGVPLAAITLGACVIEKHFTLSRADGGVDSTFSMEPDELRLLMIESERAFLSIGKVLYGIQEKEQKSLRFKRSVYIVKNVVAGEKLTEENLRIIRPGDGLPPKYYEVILGKSAVVDIKAGTPFQWDLLS